MGKHLTERERYYIEIKLKEGLNGSSIATLLKRPRSTIYNEIKRGTVQFLNSDFTYRKEYCADVGQRIYLENSRRKGRRLKIGFDFELSNFIEEKIGNERFSPYALVQYMQNHNISFKTSVCWRTIYNYLDMGIFLTISNANLPSKKNKKRSYNKIHKIARHNIKGRSIEERPASVADRVDLYHWEMDTVYSGKKTSKTCLLVLTERFTREEIIVKMKDRTQQEVIRALNRLEKFYGYKRFKRTFKTITCDNGSEFLDFNGIENSCISKNNKRTELFFCHPFSSWERGSNENSNKLIRRWIKKGDDIGKYSDSYIKFIQKWINNYPRKIFDGLSSEQFKASLL
ncbi:MAG: IS30 family transposase [Lachnospiraceae bacterium]|nr:IS30 family transposase [Lachnospiraceae bacterium]